LPDYVKRELPAISFAGHVYSSTKSQRSVMLNGKKMREGQEVSKGLMLEEITLEGVVLRAQGYRFKLGALQDWSFP
jgi:general secretion pathway protein B